MTRVACGHDGEAFGAPICEHLRAGSTPWVSYVKWYTGAGMATELLCVPCADARGAGTQIAVAHVCRMCFDNATEEVGDLIGNRGSPEILVRPHPFDTRLLEAALPAALGPVTDVAPIEGASTSLWLLLSEDGGLIKLDAETLEWSRLAQVSVPSEPERKTWNHKEPRRRLHVSSRGEFAAVVNDFGRWGQIVDLRSGEMTISLDGGDYHPETVPFSFAFIDRQGLTLAIHRTGWNRLDISDAATGACLTSRPQPLYVAKQRPEHYLDYFHGRLLTNPNATFVFDDGWVWHPVGVPAVWSLDRWLENVWESEDGPSRVGVCARSYYWNGPVVWMDDQRLALGGIGSDDNEMVPGARMFDVLLHGPAGPPRRSDGQCVREVRSFAGPKGTFFSDGKWLFSSDDLGLSRWDVNSGERTGQLSGFCPARHHLGAHELLELRGRSLLRLRLERIEAGRQSRVILDQ